MLGFSVLHAQIDFDNYKPLLCEGPIPGDFSKMTYVKVEEDMQHEREQLSKTQQKSFLTGINYAIDAMLHSGFVTYGDPLTLYVDKVVGKLLEKDPVLKSKLRFYMLKSTDVNAFSTDQGIVFVTTGLLAQINSEAHLAYVLSHEIAHYTKQHVIETFDLRVNPTNRRTKDFSVYSRDKELEADKVGLEMFHAAGYSSNELINTFDVLMYSYLPFDEQKFSLDYFNKSGMFVPRSIFGSDSYPIKANENYDDDEATHPNIRKRKEAAIEEIKRFESWGSTDAFFPREEFERIRRTARFEMVRLEIFEARFVNALYAIYLLEKEVPNSTYLNKMKAHAWLGLAQYKEAGEFSSTYRKTSKLEGESAILHHYVSRMVKDEVFAMAIRIITDIVKANPNDLELVAIQNRLIEVIASTTRFKMESFSSRTYQEQIAISSTAQQEVLPDQKENETSDSKYDKIKKSRNISSTIILDSNNYYLFGLSDLVKENTFSKLLEDTRSEMNSNWKKAHAEKRNFNDEFSFFEYTYQVKVKNQRGILGGSMIVAEPDAYIGKNTAKNKTVSEKLAEEFSNIIIDVASEMNIQVKPIGRPQIALNGTDMFNDRMTFQNAFIQLGNDEVATLPVDFSRLNELSNKYNSSQILFSLVEYQKRKLPIGNYFLGALISFPILFVYVPITVFNRHNTTLTTVIYNIDKGFISEVNALTCKTPLMRRILKGYVYDYFFQLKNK